MFGAVRAPRVYEHIVAQIERAIYEGRFAHGDKLPPERQLVREFGASRVAVREALRALEHRGLVAVRQGSAGGYFIRELDATPVVRDFQTLFRLGRVSLAQLAEARALLEPESARLAAARVTDTELKALGECLDARTEPGLISRRRRALDAEFHRRGGAARPGPPPAARALAAAAPCAAQAPVRIGEINSFSGIGAPFTGPYRQAIEMAVEEVNAKSGVLGRKVEVLFRDDKGQPAEAVKHAQELVASEKVSLIAGTFLSNVGLAVSDWAKQNKTLFVAAEPLTEAITWAKGHDHVFRVRPNTYEQGRMLAEKAGKLKYVKWATIGPNYEYGKRAWETFRDRLKELKPDVQVVGEHWPTLGKLEAGPFVTAILNQNPDALYVSLFGSDWIAFVREAGKRGLFQKTFVVGLLLGEPEYIDPLKLEAPEGMLVTGYPWYDIQSAAHKEWVARFTKQTDHTPVLGSLVGYVTYVSIAEAIRKAGSTDTDKLVAALRGLKVETPVGPIIFRASDGQSTLGAWVGTTKLDAKRGVGIMTNWEYVPGERVLPSDDEVKKLRSGS